MNVDCSVLNEMLLCPLSAFHPAASEKEVIGGNVSSVRSLSHGAQHAQGF